MIRRREVVAANLLAYSTDEREHAVIRRTFEVFDTSDTSIVLPLRGVQLDAGPNAGSEFRLSNETQNAPPSIADHDSVADAERKRLDVRITASMAAQTFGETSE